jgi:hypothetical protein
MRMTPAEIAASAKTLDNNQIGSSGLEGVHTKVLFGNPEKAGYYAILLFVPAHTTIQAHSHLGYGDHFDAQLLKALPPGSVYSEPGGRKHNHFARTDATDVIVEISGYGPTDTVYFERANDPNLKGKK